MRLKVFWGFCLLLLSIFITTVSNAELIARYEFNGNANDIINRYTGSFRGNAQVAIDPDRGQVLSLDGNGDYVGCGSSFAAISASNTKTIMAWAKSDTNIYPSGSTVGGRILTLYRQGGYTAYSIYGAGNPATWEALYAPTPSDWAKINSSKTVATNSWTHVALVQNGTTISIYINGILANIATNASIPTVSSPSEAQIGTFYNNNYFDGMIDDVRIYNVALTETQIQDAMFNNELGPNLTELEIMGPPQVSDNWMTQYKAIAHYDNNTTRDVTNLASWSCQPIELGEINSNGLLTTNILDQLRAALTISAQYSEGDVNLMAQKPVEVIAVCPKGTTLKFDGINDVVNCGNDPSINNLSIFSVSLWFNTNFIPHGTRYPAMIGQAGYAAPSIVLLLNLHGDYNGRVHVNIGSGTSLSDRALSTANFTPKVDTWYHCVITYDDTTDRTIRIYIDGKEYSYLHKYPALGTKFSNPSIPVTIGNSSDVSTYRAWKGSLDEIAVYNKILSPAEIQMLTYQKPNRGNPNLVAYWAFDEGQGQIAHDLSGNDNFGILGSTPNVDNSDPMWVDSIPPIGLCTLEDIVGRNLKEVFEIKLSILEELQRALNKEQATLEMLNTSFKNRDFGSANKNDVVKAKQRIHTAIQHEIQADNFINKSLDNLEDAVNTLKIDMNSN